MPTPDEPGKWDGRKGLGPGLVDPGPVGALVGRRQTPHRVGRGPGRSGALEDDLVLAEGGARRAVVAELGQDLVAVLAEERGAGDLRGERGELDRAADRQEGAAALLLDLDHRAALAQVLIVGELLHGQDRGAGHLPLAEDVDGLELGL